MREREEEGSNDPSVVSCAVVERYRFEAVVAGRLTSAARHGSVMAQA